ncbi:sodium-dependent transporter [Clostridium cochlearium]|uniref:Neurotransmitter:Na+ symporter, NSS family n=1 Tax=Clostridium cochlearium TaxID=1494 RepID=A0A240ALB3_CLOCO|nr:sodium-dependent transporter [Clostridium cochlearium]MBV1818708.1 sodium-dependent transporter [Bacteroidales bacterium MSK.15.36]NSJ91136.1 sodium-dependent transporter [Coprococcus sp. MSK.21.13]MBU5270171.1 sodium-dependent transporter [Clostridium cochlearium]MCG4571864.1 sodium-dependent transporter [Clostridium cochlearium]MCG4580553.1 sodium-dependent transporter [Clostridium cochlearium]
MEGRETFTSKLGFIMSCLGSAIGLGNIWMFPWKLGQYGGAAFLIPYFIFVYLLGVTGLIGEFAFGRWMKGGSFEGIQKVFKKKNLPAGKAFSLIPAMAVGGTLIFYAVVVGWTFKYFFEAVKGSFFTLNMEELFNGFTGSKLSIFWAFVAIFVTLLIVNMGVIKGIENLNKIMMPSLFVIFVILLIRSLTLPGAMEGVAYLVKPRWDYLLKPVTWVMALGQAFFTVSLNGAGMVVYGSYLKEEEDIPKASMQIAIFDTLSALLAAFVIIPAVFAFGLNPSAGPSLLFITMPYVFKSMPFGYAFGILFFISIIFAAVSSLINMMEATSEAFLSQFKIGRVKGVAIISIMAFIIGIPLNLSMDVFGKWADFVTIYLAPLGTMISAITFYWIYGMDKALIEINKGCKEPLGNWFKPLGKYVFVISSILVLILGVIYNGIG